MKYFVNIVILLLPRSVSIFTLFIFQFTPCKELISISRILKNDLSESHMLDNSEKAKGFSNNSGSVPEVENETRLKLKCVRMLLNLAKHNVLFKDVFREVGILEVLITCLHRFGSDLQTPDHRKG